MIWTTSWKPLWSVQRTVISRIASSSRRAADLSFQDWQYLATAVKELFIARFRHAIRPLGKILSELQEECLQADNNAGGKVDLVCLSWAIGAAAARVPWRSDCLPQAMAAHRWLRRYGLRPEFFVGVAKKKDGQVEVHAWLRCGDLLVTGGDGRDFTILTN